ncbi:glycoside hydrolase family 16 protein [Peniophora sp. CONT]|nr:glycoside hydrolase family 16 protein [Peniophora sp. CONT]
MSLHLFLALLGAAALPAATATGSYSLVEDFSGTTFFDKWTFYDNFDNLTNGDVIWVSEETARSTNLAYVNAAGNAIMKVDNHTQVASNQKRNSVRIASNDEFRVGSVFVADMLHVPFGCSVWPAWWSQAPHWPSGGEIDMFEGVNMVTHNQYALHTEDGCTISNPLQTGIDNSTNCAASANSNQGCVVTDTSTQSYGESFASSGGGVFVTEFAESGISIWFFSRSEVPSSLSGNSSTIDTSAFGTPSANYPTDSCNIDKFFSAQHLIFDITLCGDFAGNPTVFAQTCSGSCYSDYVIGSPTNYDNAYFEVQHVRVYGGNDTVVPPSEQGAASSLRPSLWQMFKLVMFSMLIPLWAA